MESVHWDYEQAKEYLDEANRFHVKQADGKVKNYDIFKLKNDNYWQQDECYEYCKFYKKKFNLKEPLHKLFRYSNSNKTYNKYDLQYGEVPQCIKDLSEIEIKVLSIILAHVSVIYTQKGRNKSFKGHCLNFMKDL